MNATKQTNEMVPFQQFEQLKNQLEAVRKKDMAKLGDGAMFWIEEDSGEKKRGFRCRVDLSIPDQVCFIKDKPMICAAGYDKANQYAGVEIVRPKTVVIDGGREVGNPYFEKDENGSLTSIFIRGLGVGYAPTGSLAVVDQTVFVNLNTLLLQEVQAKLKYDPTIATLGVQGQKPESFVAVRTRWEKKRKVVDSKETIKVEGAWHFLPVASGMGYWIDLSHPDIQGAFEGYVQKQRFLERSSTTVLRRLILASHPAIATKTPDVIRDNQNNPVKASMIVYGFRAEAGNAKKKREDMANLAEKLAAGQSAADMEIIKKDVADVTEDAEVLNVSSVADPTEIPPDEPPAGFEDDLVREENPFPAEAPQVGTETKPQQQVELTAQTKLKAALADKAHQAAFMAVCKEMNTGPSALRKAPDEIIEDFLFQLQKEVAK